VARTINVVVRFDDLTSVSRSQTLPFGVDDEYAVEAVAHALVGSVDLSKAVRLLGLHASGLLERRENQVQLSFGLEAGSSDAKADATARSRARQAENGALRDAIDEVRRRYGRTSVGTASELSERGLDPATQRGRHAFGPEAQLGVDRDEGADRRVGKDGLR
jgi:hypothetical protein